MADQNDRDAGLLVVVADLAQDGIAAFGVKACCGFVQHQDLGLHGHTARNGNAALLPAGKFKRAFLQQRFIQANKLCRALDAAGDLFFIQAHVARAIGDILPAGFFKQLVFRVLHDQPHKEAEIPQVFALRPHIAAINNDLAAGGAVQAVEMGDQRGFAGPGRAHHTDKITFFNREAHIIQRCGFVRHTGVIHIAQMFHFNDF